MPTGKQLNTTESQRPRSKEACSKSAPIADSNRVQARDSVGLGNPQGTEEATRMESATRTTITWNGRLVRVDVNGQILGLISTGSSCLKWNKITLGIDIACH